MSSEAQLFGEWPRYTIAVIVRLIFLSLSLSPMEFAVENDVWSQEKSALSISSNLWINDFHDYSDLYIPKANNLLLTNVFF